MANEPSLTIVRAITPAPRDLYRQIFCADVNAMPYQSPEWLDTLRRQNGFEDATIYYELSNGKRLILPLIRTPIRPRHLAICASGSLKYGFGGLLCDQPLTAHDVALVMQDLHRRKYLHLTVRPNPCLADVWARGIPNTLIRIPRFAHVIPLKGGFGHVADKLFTKSTRNRLRRAERLGVEVEYDSTGRLIPVFHELLQHSIKRWTKRQNEPIWLAKMRLHGFNPTRKLKIMAETMGSACTIWVASLRGEPICASIVLQHQNANDIRNVLNYELSSQTGANDLILSLSIQRACESGCSYYHLGESGRSEGLANFKQRFGAIGYAYNEYVVEHVPVTKAVEQVRSAVKRVIGFRDI